MGILDVFDKFRDTVFLKDECELEERVRYLEELIKREPKNTKVKEQLFMAKKGLEGENEIIYQLEKANIGMFVLHDINIEYEDLNAQIDFIVITPWCCYFIECKNLLGNITVDEKGDFIREYTYEGHKIKKGMESPYRQVCAQREVYRKIWRKTQGKLKSFVFEKDFEDLYRVLVVAANGENILNTKYAPKDIKYNVIKADGLIRKIEYDRDHSDKSLWDTKNEMEKWANYFLRLNVPKKIDYISIIKEDQVKENRSEQKEEKLEEDLRNKLIEFRKIRSKEKNIPAYYVFNNEELERLIEFRPKTLEELKELNIITKIKAIAHGKEIIEIINKHR